MAKRFQQGAIVTEASPIGTVKAYAGGTAPSGWLLCDGSAISRTTYAALFALIGTTYDTQTNETTGSAFAAPAGTDFRVPDYRGLFLRGVGSPSGLDAVTLGGRQTTKTKLPVSSFTINKNQWNSNQIGHNHGINAPQQTYNIAGAFLESNQFWWNYSGSTTSNSSISWNSSNANIDGGGDNETRPLNKGVNYIIKF